MTVHPQTAPRMNREFSLMPWFMLILVLLAPGCVTNQPWVVNREPASNICQVTSFWDSRIQVTQDVVNGGRPLAGLAGRLYFFGPELKYPEKCEGTVAIDLYDVTNAHAGVPPKRLERWQWDSTNLTKLLRKDKIGWGYTMFLPWSTISPEITRVKLAVTYTPPKGNPIFGEPDTITLRNEATITQTRVPVQSAPSLVKN